VGVKFYILIPVYNSELFLHKCINSILCQTYHNYEVVLVDDGSQDKSGEICDLYAKDHANIHIIHQENKGQIAARCAAENYVLEHHNGDEAFIIYVDSDDTVEEEMLESLAQIIDSDNPDIVIYNYRRVTPDGDLVSEQSDTGAKEELDDKRIVYRRLLFDDSYNSLCRKAVNIANVTPVDHSVHFHIRHGEDLIRSLDYLKAARKVIFYDKIFYNYVVNPASVTQSKKNEKHIKDTELRKIVFDFLREEKVFSEEDYKDYWLFVQTFLHHEIKRIAYMSISTSEKTELYQNIREDFVWKKCMEVEAKDCIIKLFNQKKYKTIFFIYSVRRFLAKIKATIKR